MKSKKIIKLNAKDVEKMIKDLSVLVVSLDRLGSTFHDRPRRLRIETNKFLNRVEVFKILARTRCTLSEAFDSQSAKKDVEQLEEAAEKLDYWHEGE